MNAVIVECPNLDICNLSTRSDRSKGENRSQNCKCSARLYETFDMAIPFEIFRISIQKDLQFIFFQCGKYPTMSFCSFLVILLYSANIGKFNSFAFELTEAILGDWPTVKQLCYLSNYPVTFTTGFIIPVKPQSWSFFFFACRFCDA